MVLVTEEKDGKSIYSFDGSNVFTINKQAMLQGAPAATTAKVVTNPQNEFPSVFSMVPARKSGGARGGMRNTFLMATPVDRFFGGSLNTLQLFSLTGTDTLSGPNPDVRLEWVQKEVALDFDYSMPPPSNQKDGPAPYQGIARDITSSFANMASVTFVNSLIYCSWGSAVEVGVKTVAGVAWAAVNVMSPERAKQGGLLGLGGGNNLLVPHLAVRVDGRGVLAVSVSGPDYYPSAAYAVLVNGQMGPVSLAAEGGGVLDAYSGYDYEGTRFGYFASALVDDTGSFYIASMYVAQSCNYTSEQFYEDPTCAGTRSLSANWHTRISKVTVAKS